MAAPLISELLSYFPLIILIKIDLISLISHTHLFTKLILLSHGDRANEVPQLTAENAVVLFYSTLRNRR